MAGAFVDIFSSTFSISIAQAAPVITALAAWFAAQNGRKVRVKIGDFEAEARTVEEVQKLLQQAKEFQEKKSAKDDGGSR